MSTVPVVDVTRAGTYKVCAHLDGILKLSEVLNHQSWPAQRGVNAGCRIGRNVASVPSTVTVNDIFPQADSVYVPPDP